MTAWRAARITVTLASDLHCPDRPLGFVARALPFVPAHIPWYALVPRVVALLGWPDQFNSYDRVETAFNACLRFTPFFPLDANDRPLFPWDEGRCRIERELLGSRHGVSVFYDPRGARANHLFETETLLARSRSGAPTRLRGYGFWKEEEHSGIDFTAEGGIGGKSLAGLLAGCQWGGQRSQGMGALTDVKTEIVQNVDGAFGRTLDLNADFPRIAAPESRIPYYLRYEEKLAGAVQGRITPLTGRRYARDRGYGLAADPAVIAWALGWRFGPGPDTGQRVLILEDRRYAVMADSQ